MNFRKDRVTRTQGLFGAQTGGSEEKSLLCLWQPLPDTNNLLEELADAGWRILLCDNSAQLREILASTHVTVGMVLVDCAWEQAQLEDIYSAIRSASQLTWYAVLADRRPISSAACDLVAVYCDDFFSPPYDTRRIKQSLGHGAGMCLLRQRNTQAQLGTPAFEGMIGKSESMNSLFRNIQKIAKSEAPVLLLGESGTGKELTARAIHHLSSRGDGPFKVINCAAVPASLIQSELFGHEKGAFTGAQSRYQGRLETAQNGVIFLDEISDMPLEQQVNLLRFLEDKCIERLGGSDRIQLDVRVIAATHDNLAGAVENGSFREDLYYRLNVLRLNLPSLRHRLQDVEALANFALLRFADEAGNGTVRGFTRDAVHAMENHSWPGNVRELINRVRRALVMAENHMITASDLDLEPGGKDAVGQKVLLTLEDYRQEADRRAIESALRQTRHNISEAARQLEISRTTLYRMMEKLSIQS